MVDPALRGLALRGLTHWFALYLRVGVFSAVISVCHGSRLCGLERGERRLGRGLGDSEGYKFGISLEAPNQISEVRGQNRRLRERGQRSEFILFISASHGCPSSPALFPRGVAGGRGHGKMVLRPPWRWCSGLVPS